MEAYQRFIRYAVIPSASKEDSDTFPSTPEQRRIAEILIEDMKEIGFTDLFLSDTGYVYGDIPATEGLEEAPPLGFIAHMDTAPDASGEHVSPQIHGEYDGGDVALSDTVTLTVQDFPHLRSLRGRTLITTDGSTLLGADDKAGIAEILTACQIILSERRPHGKICVAFTPDEEVGNGAKYFDIPRFGARYAYTVDGGPENCIEWENFNAANAKIQIHGKSVHPGTAKDIMINALVVACELNALLPQTERPEHTEGYEGFFFLHRISGDIADATMEYNLRDHDARLLEERKTRVRDAAEEMNRLYGKNTVEVEITDTYGNMAEVIRRHKHLIENAKVAMIRAGLVPEEEPLRGGTDGATLSFRGLPCPNLGTGGYAYHGIFEHITAEGMERATEVLLELISIYSEYRDEEVSHDLSEMKSDLL